MLSAVSQSVDRVSLSDDDDRGSGRISLTGDHTNPKLNIALTRQLSPDELVSFGYRQSFEYGTMRGSLCNDPNYLHGWGEGYKARQSAKAAS